ncbi:MAG TPA: PorT family protein [Niabella sp.]|nr:PorT family protein [Niabella sp.]
MHKKFKNMSDKELDKLFRDAVNRFTYPDAPVGKWQEFIESRNLSETHDFEAKLPNVNSQTNRRIPFLLYWKVAGVLVAIILSGLIMLYRSTNRQIVDTIDSGEPKSKRIEQNDIGSSNEKLPTAQNEFEQQARTQLNDNKKKQDLLKVGIHEYSKYLVYKKETKPISVNSDLKLIKLGKLEGMQLLKMPLSKSILLKRWVSDLNQKRVLNKTGEIKDRNVRSNFNILENVRARGNSKSTKWQVGVVGGAIMSTVKNKVSGKPGLNTGVVIQRRISGSKVSIESGVFYSNMSYAVQNEDFNPNGKPVSSRVSNISGTCSMLDVPINVRYDMVNSKHKNRKAFVSTGVSPTVMLKQSYVYDFTNENETRLINKDVSGKGKSMYAVANLSVGYEQKFNRTSVQIAPYLKLPLGEVGYGDLSLGGMGALLSIKRDL